MTSHTQDKTPCACNRDADAPLSHHGINCEWAKQQRHTQKKSIREELQQVVSAVINTVKEHGLSRGDATHDIMSAFDTALEAIAQKGETLFYLPEGDVGAARMQRKFHNDGIRAFQEIIRSNKSS